MEFAEIYDDKDLEYFHHASTFMLFWNRTDVGLFYIGKKPENIYMVWIIIIVA